jgi:flagellar M-ring protein FliF
VDGAGGQKGTSTRRKRTPEEMKEIEQLARAAIGVDAQRGDVLAVENLSFQELPLETPAPRPKSINWRRLLEPWAWTLRYLAVGLLFLVVYGLILRPVKKQAVAAFRELPKKLAQAIAAAALPRRRNLPPEAQRLAEGPTWRSQGAAVEEDADRQGEGRAGGGQPAG